MIKFRTSVFLRSLDLFFLLSRNNLALVGKFVGVANCLLNRIAHVYTAKTVVYLAIIWQGRTRWRERGRTAFFRTGSRQPVRPYTRQLSLWFSIGWRERGRTGHMIKGTIQGHAFHGQARKQQCQNSISFTFPLPGRSILQISESFIEVSKFSFNFFRSFLIEIPIFYISYILFIQNVYLDRERTEKNILRGDFRAPLCCFPTYGV